MTDIVSIILGVDSRQVKDGTEALNGLGKQSSETETATDKLSGALKVSMVAAGATAVAFVAMVRAAINAADAMNDMHLKTGLSFQSLAAYDQLARQSGTSLEGVASGFKFLSKNIIENADKMAALGITAKNTDEAMAQFADVIAGINDPALKSALAMDVLGRSGVELLPLLAGGSAAFLESKKSTEEYAKQLALAAPMADAFNDKMELFATGVKTAGLSIAVAMLPVLSRMADFISGAIQSALKLWEENVHLVKGAIAGLLATLATFAALSLPGIVMALAAAFVVLAAKIYLATAAMIGFLASVPVIGWLAIAVGAGVAAWAAWGNEAEKAGGKAKSAFDGAASSMLKWSAIAKEKAEKELLAKIAQVEIDKQKSAASKKYIDSLQNEIEMLGLNEDQKTMMEAAQQARLAGNEKEAMSIMTKATALVAERTRLDEVKQAAIQKEEVIAHNDNQSAEILNRELERNKLMEESTKQLLAVQEAKYITLNDAAIYAEATELERAVLKRDREMMDLAASYELAAASHTMTEAEEERYQQAMANIQRKYSAGKKQSDIQMVQFGNAIKQGEYQTAMQLAMQMTAGIAGHSRKAFEINKAAATANAVISTYKGVAGVLGAFPGPVGWVMAVAQVALGLAQVSAIQATQFGGGSASAGGGGVPSMATSPGIPTAPQASQSAPSAPTEQQAQPIQISIYNTGTFVDAQAFVDNTIIPQIRDQITNSDVLLIDPRSRQAQVLGAA